MQACRTDSLLLAAIAFSKIHKISHKPKRRLKRFPRLLKHAGLVKVTIWGKMDSRVSKGDSEVINIEPYTLAGGDHLGRDARPGDEP